MTGPLEELLPDVLDGTIEPGKVFDRSALKVMIRP